MNASQIYGQQFKANPARNRATMLQNTINHMPQDRYGYSDLAKIPMMWAAGKSMGEAEQIDQQNLQTAMDMQRKQLAQSEMKNIIEISKVDPELASTYLNQVSGEYPELAGFKGYKFNQPTTKEFWSTVTAGDGQVYQVWLPGFGRLQNTEGMTGDQMMQEGIKQRFIIPIGGPKQTKEQTETEQTKAYAEGAKTEITNRAAEAWKGENPGLNPALGSVAARYATSGQTDAIDQYAEAGKKGEERIKEMVSPKPTKQIERTVDLGDRIRTIYTDGTTSEEPKGAAPRASGSGSDGEGSEAKIGKLNLIEKLIAERFLPTAKADAKNRGEDPMDFGDTTTGSVSIARVYDTLHPENRSKWNRVKISAQKYAATMTPAEAVNRALQDIQAPTAPTQTTKTTAPAPTGGKPLDKTTAMKFLRQANGDKNKARELARQQGYSF